MLVGVLRRLRVGRGVGGRLRVGRGVGGSVEKVESWQGCWCEC